MFYKLNKNIFINKILHIIMNRLSTLYIKSIDKMFVIGFYIGNINKKIV